MAKSIVAFDNRGRCAAGAVGEYTCGNRLGAKKPITVRLQTEIAERERAEETQRNQAK
ncbi:MAG: hypothetical protein R3B47_18685 [Bacteroidia bacterium]